MTEKSSFKTFFPTDLSLRNALVRGWGVAQCVECQVWGAVDVGSVESDVVRDFSSPESAFDADSLTESAQPPCAIACINILRTLKTPSTGSHAVVWTRKYCTR